MSLPRRFLPYKSGRSDVIYYAQQLNATSKYLSDTVKRQTGKSATHDIDRYTVPMERDVLPAYRYLLKIKL